MFGTTSHAKAGKKGGMIGAPVGSPPRSKANSAAASGMASVHGDAMSEAREAQLAAWHESQLKLYQQIMGMPEEKVTIAVAKPPGLADETTAEEGSPVGGGEPAEPTLQSKEEKKKEEGSPVGGEVLVGVPGKTGVTPAEPTLQSKEGTAKGPESFSISKGTEGSSIGGEMPKEEMIHDDIASSAGGEERKAKVGTPGELSKGPGGDEGPGTHGTPAGRVSPPASTIPGGYQDQHKDAGEAMRQGVRPRECPGDELKEESRKGKG